MDRVKGTKREGTRDRKCGQGAFGRAGAGQGWDISAVFSPVLSAGRITFLWASDEFGIAGPIRIRLRRTLRPKRLG